MGWGNLEDSHEKARRGGSELLGPEDVPTPFAELDQDGRLMAANRALLELTGFGDLQSIPLLIELIPLEWRPDNPRAKPEAGTKHISTELPTADGAHIQVEAFICQAGGDRPGRFLASIIDASELEAPEACQLQAEGQVTAAYEAFDAIRQPIFVTTICSTAFTSGPCRSTASWPATTTPPGGTNGMRPASTPGKAAGWPSS